MNEYPVSKLLHYCNISVPRSSEIYDRLAPYYDLTFVLSGRLVYIVNGEKIVLKKNDAIFIPPNTMNSRVPLEEGVSYVSFNFFSEEDIPIRELFLENIISSDIRKIISAFPHRHIMPGSYSREKAMNILNFILLELVSCRELSTSNERVLECVRYIDEHVSEKLSLSCLAKKMNLSREHLSYIFKRETGKTLTDYVNSQKMQAARALIESGEMSLGDVSEQLGFENYNYFSRLFRKYFDISPVEIRKKNL